MVKRQTHQPTPHVLRHTTHSPDAAAGRLLNFLTDHVVTKTLSAVEQLAETHGMDHGSHKSILRESTQDS